jgi:hypothetical protein
VTEPQEPRGTTPNHLTSDELSECAFSPQTAAAGWLEHAQGCAECSAELADLTLLLTELAELPEPELPESVVIRLDAAVARAWQEADAEQEAAAAATASAGTRRGGRLSWRKIALPIGSLALIALAVLGVGSLLHNGADSNSSSASSGNAPAISAGGRGAQSNGSLSESSLAQWVHSLVSPTGTEGPRQATAMAHDERCAVIPPRAGYTVLTTSQRDFEGVPATLVVYQNAQEPSSNTVYAVVYEGSCPSSTSGILLQGPVSR